jgi:hypothetical protein
MAADGRNHEAIDSYLRDLGMGEALRTRALEFASAYERLINEPVEDAFVNDYVDEDGTRQYQSLWLASKSYVIEAKQWVSDNELQGDAASVRGGFLRVDVSRHAYEFTNTTAQSRMKAEVTWSEAGLGGLRGRFQSSGANCGKLYEFIRKYVMPRMV